MTWVNNVIEARADDNGDYKICGLPTRRIVTMEAADKTIIDEKTKQTRLATIRVAELDTHAEMGLAIAENRAIAWTGGR